MSDPVRLGPWQLVPGGRERRAATREADERSRAHRWRAGRRTVGGPRLQRRLGFVGLAAHDRRAEVLEPVLPVGEQAHAARTDAEGDPEPDVDLRLGLGTRRAPLHDDHRVAELRVGRLRERRARHATDAAGAGDGDGDRDGFLVDRPDVEDVRPLLLSPDRRERPEHRCARRRKDQLPALVVDLGVEDRQGLPPRRQRLRARPQPFGVQAAGDHPRRRVTGRGVEEHLRRRPVRDVPQPPADVVALVAAAGDLAAGGRVLVVASVVVIFYGLDIMQLVAIMLVAAVLLRRRYGLENHPGG